MHLSDYKVLTFDCYGTLIDWEAGIWDAYQPLLMANNYSEVTRDGALESHAIFESEQETDKDDCRNHLHQISPKVSAS